MAAPLTIPGYAFDGKRYYKLPKGGSLPSSIHLLPPNAPSSSDIHRKPKGRQGESRTSRNENEHDDDPDLFEGAKRGEGKRKRIRLEGGYTRDRIRAWNLHNILSSERSTGWTSSSTTPISHRMQGCMVSRLETARTLYPEMPLEESISRISFEDLNPSIIRLGGSQGSIITGDLDREKEIAYYPNDEQGWRTSWMFGSPVTSLNTSGYRMLATCLGPQAKALVAQTDENSPISLASVTLSPQKTAIWTSAISSSIIALGCDRKVLISRNVERAIMEGYTTGDRHGGGSAFALDLSENLIFAGTRKGKVKIFDQRSTKTSRVDVEERQRAELQFGISSAVTYLKRIKEGLLLSGMDGTLAMYDVRFPRPTPLLSMKGHHNEYTRDLGIDTLKDEFVVAAGQDRKIRLWSLRDGQRLSVSRINRDKDQPTTYLLDKTFEEPITALRFQPERSRTYEARRDDGWPRLRSRSEIIIETEEREQKGNRSTDEPVLWIGQGPSLLSYSLPIPI